MPADTNATDPRTEPDSTPPDSESRPDTSLPVPVEHTRTYLHVRPTDTTLDPDLAIRQCRRLHSLDGHTPSSSRLRSLLTDDSPPTIECLIVSEGGDDTSLWYAFGIDDEELVDTLERTLRSIFPNPYEIDRSTRIPGFQGRLLGEVQEPADDEDTNEPTDPDNLAAIEYRGRINHPRDWMAPLTAFDESSADTQKRVPLASLVETMAERSVPIVYQALIRPRPDWAAQAENRDVDLQMINDTLWDRVVSVFTGIPEDLDDLPRSYKTRREDLDERETHCSFDVNARVVAIGREDPGEAERAIRELTSTFSGLTTRQWHEIDGRPKTGKQATHVFTATRDRTFVAPNYGLRHNSIPFTARTSPGIVADVTELPSFCLLDGSSLTTAGARAVAPTPGERTGIARPSFDLLSRYLGKGLPIGRPVTDDNQPDLDPIVINRSLQTLHLALIGATGSGKSILLTQALLANHQATGGADILIDPKGDGMALDYLRAHYAVHGDLDNVLYFNCAEVLPAISFFDIRPELEAGVSRTTAVEDVVDHYIEMLRQIMGRERFDQAVRSPDIIRYLVKAMFDPVSGHTEFRHRHLQSAVRTMRERQTVPVVSDAELDDMLRGVVANNARTFDEIMQGVANRIEKIPVDSRLGAMFNHLPEDEADPHFDLERYLDEDVAIVLDTGGLRPEAQRVLTLVVLSKLWTALRRRKRRGGSDENPLVNLSIEEAASVALSDLLQRFLAQARGFDCSVTLSMQFPGQLQGYDQDIYDEILNNVGTFVVGPVPSDRRLAERLATEEMEPQEVGNRLRALQRGQWLVSLPAAFGEPKPRPFLVESEPLPPGHPEGDQPLSTTQEVSFDMALDSVRERTLDEAGITLAEPSTVPAREEGDEDEEETAEEDPDFRVDSPLPHTKRMPTTVRYQEGTHALQCTECGSRYDPNREGMERAISCCGTLTEVDRDDVPICDLNLKLTPEERQVSEWTDRQLLFLQAVYNAQQLRYQWLGYDLLWDSMIRLQEYVGIDAEEVQDLIDDDLLRHDTDHPHRLYTVTAQGRDVIGEHQREGVDFGHAVGDLGESSVHALMVEVARLYLVQTYAADPDSPITEVVPYYEMDDHHRLDVVGLDEAGDIRVAVEAERVNHDILRAVPDDFDKMAACEPDEAIWVVMSQADGHAVLQALNDPPEGDSRVAKTYSTRTPTQQFRIDTPGLTAVYPVEWLRDRLEARPPGHS